MSTTSGVYNTSAPATISSMARLLANPLAPSFGSLITVKLMNTNYLLWKTQFLPYLRSQQLLSYVDGTTPQPPVVITQTTTDDAVQVPNPAHQQWLIQDQLVLSALLFSLQEDILGRVLLLNALADVWRALEGMFSSRSRARIMQIWMQLSTMTKGLGEDYDPLVVSITTRMEPISLTELYAHMLSFEMRKEHHNNALQISANNVVRNAQGSRDNSQGKERGGNNVGDRWKPNANSNSSPVTISFMFLRLIGI